MEKLRILKIRKSKKISFSVKPLLHCVQLWPVSVSVAQMKTLDAAHHRWQQRISRKHKVTNDKSQRGNGTSRV